MRKRELKKLLGVPDTELDKLIAAGLPTNGVGEALEWQIARLRRTLKQRDESPDDVLGAEVRKERARYFRAQALTVELETGRDSGDMTHFGEWQRAANSKIVEARQNLLSLPRRVSYRLLGEEPKTVLGRLREEVELALIPLVLDGPLPNLNSSNSLGTQASLTQSF